MIEMTKAQARKLIRTEFWKTMTDRQRAEFQLFTERLCMPFDVFHKAVEETLGRPVFTHELALNLEALQAELRGDRDAPTAAEILELVPPDKLIAILTN